MTTTRIVFRGPHNTVSGNPHRSDTPRNYVVNADWENDGLERCPFIYVSDAYGLQWRDTEVDRLREYLDRGGFIWVDDSWSLDGWESFVAETGRIVDYSRHLWFDLPADHPILTSPYVVDPRDHQQSHLSFWRGNRGETSEFGETSTDVWLRGIEDDHGRLMVLATWNTDVGDAWEQDRSSDYFETFAAPGYAFGVNVVIYALTH